MDRRKHYFIVIDTETCNGIVENNKLNLSFSLVYDIGWQVVDKKGNVYERASFIVDEIYNGEKSLMTTCYYKDKLVQYDIDIFNGSRIVKSFYEIRQILIETMKEYNITEICAHNSAFDLNALNTTQRWLTKSKYRYFFPYGTEIWDSQKMAHDTICKQKMYIEFCKENGYMTKHKTPRPRETAEILYRYISKQFDFVESHTGLEDVEIETKIVAKCFAQHKKMRKKLYEN